MIRVRHRCGPVSATRGPDPGQTAVRGQQRQRGFVTAELAASFPAIVVLLLVGLFAVTAVTTQTRCADAAREAVLAEARGEDGSVAAKRHMPSTARLDVETAAGTVTAEVVASVYPLGTLLPPVTVRGEATAAREDRVVS